MPRSQRNDNFIDKTFTILADILLKVLPTPRPAKEAFAYYRDGLAAQSEGEYAEALRNYYEALRLEFDPYDRSYILYNIGLIHTANGQHARALEYYFAALQRNPSLPQALNNIAVVHHYRAEQALEAGQVEVAQLLFEKAAEYWREAIRLAPTNYIEAQNWLQTTGRYRLGTIHLDFNRIPFFCFFPSMANQEMLQEARPVFPFTAIVGQEEMKLALLLNVIDPKIGGVMVMGDRGTGKSTTVRALVDLLPEIQVVADDPFQSDPTDPELMSEEVRDRIRRGEKVPVEARKIPMVDLPLGATEDRVCGTIDIEKALREGVKAFEPGLLARANRGILYVDEVNLLDDHLVDVLLDSAASGWNTVEREGISISHPARFILVGSGNPEEGELRPQLLDRFGMHAQIGTTRDPELRVRIVEQRASFDASPVDFRREYETSQQALRTRLIEARQRLAAVELSYDLRVRISQICSELNVDGLRGDIVTNRAARAIAAFEGRTEVVENDVARVAPLCLRHRLRKDPLETIDSGDKVREVFERIFAS